MQRPDPGRTPDTVGWAAERSRLHRSDQRNRWASSVLEIGQVERRAMDGVTGRDRRGQSRADP
jgi:hypothetical protein